MGTDARTRAREALGRGLRWVCSHPVLALMIMLIGVGIWIRTFRFGAPITDQHAFRQTQTAGTVWMWDRFGFDLFDYRVPVFGGGFWVLEFPTYQLAVFGLVKLFGFHEELGRIVSIGAYVLGSVCVFGIARRLLERRLAALAAVFFFSFLPIMVFFYRAFHIDPFALTLSLVGLYCVLRYAESPSWAWWSLATTSFGLVILTKPSVFTAIALPVASLAWRGLASTRRLRFAWPATIAAATVIIGATLAWTRHADALNATSSSMTISNLRSWYFGSTITDLGLYTTVAQRFSDNLGIVGLLCVATGLVTLFGSRLTYRRELILLLVSNALTIVVFANLNRIHDYYQLPFYFTLALLGGLGVCRLSDMVGRVSRAGARQLTVGLLGTLAVTFYLGLMGGYFSPTAVSVDVVNAGRNIAAATPDGPRIIIVGEVIDPNDPRILYEARRRGWQVDKSQPGIFGDRLRSDPALGGIAVFKGAQGVPAYVSDAVARRRMRRSFEDPYLIVFRSA